MAGKNAKTSTELVPREIGKPSLPAEQFPPVIAAAGGPAQFVWEEFIFGRIRNLNTRVAYERGIRQFLAWCEKRDLPLKRIAPSDIGRYFDQHTGASSSKNMHLSAIRHLLGWLPGRRKNGPEIGTEC